MNKMRKGFLDIILLFVIIFGLPIYIMVTMTKTHNEDIANFIQSGGSILCTKLDENKTFSKKVKITDYTDWILTEKVISKGDVSFNLFRCEKVIKIDMK